MLIIKQEMFLIIFMLIISRTKSVDWKKHIKGTILYNIFVPSPPPLPGRPSMNVIRNQKIDSLKGLESYNFLTSIQFVSHKIKSINELKSFHNLTELTLVNNINLRRIESLSKLIQLRSLLLSNNQIEFYKVFVSDLLVNCQPLFA